MLNASNELDQTKFELNEKNTEIIILKEKSEAV